MTTLDLKLIDEGNRAGAPAAPATPDREAAAGFSRLLARQMGTGSKDESPAEMSQARTREDATDNDRAGDKRPRDRTRDFESRHVDGNRPPESGKPAGGPGETSPAGETGLRLMGLEALALHNWTTQAPESGLTVGPNPAGAVALGDLAVTINSRVAGSVAARFSDRGGIQNLTLRLDPAHLGKVEVQMQAKGDHLTVRITAANREAEAALRENLRDLADTIRDRSGRFQQVEVKVDLRTADNAGKDEARKEDSSQGRADKGNHEDEGNGKNGRQQEQDEQGHPAFGDKEG